MAASLRQVSFFGAAIVVAAAVAVAGCVETTTSADGRAPAPEPVPATMTPAEAPINAVVIVAGPPVDTNGNLWRDRIDLAVYLFSQPHPTPAFRNGSIDFVIYPMGRAGSPDRPGQPMRTWTFDAAALASSRSMAVFGPCHQFSLSLLADGGDDRLQLDCVDLVAVFRPPSGEPVWTHGVTTIQLGRTPGSSIRSEASRSSS